MTSTPKTKCIADHRIQSLGFQRTHQADHVIPSSSKDIDTLIQAPKMNDSLHATTGEHHVIPSLPEYTPKHVYVYHMYVHISCIYIYIYIICVYVYIDIILFKYK